MSEIERLNALIEEAYDGLESETDLSKSAEWVTYLRSLLELRDKFYNPEVAEARQRDRELMLEKIKLTLERTKTEIRSREVMAEQLEMQKKTDRFNKGMAIGNMAVNVGSTALGAIQHKSDVDKVLTIEAGGKLTTRFGQSWEQNLARNS